MSQNGFKVFLKSRTKFYGFFPKIFCSKVWIQRSEKVKRCKTLGQILVALVKLIKKKSLCGFQSSCIELLAQKVYTKFQMKFQKSLNPIVCQKWLFFHHYQWNGYKSIIEQASSPLLYPSQQQV